MNFSCDACGRAYSVPDEKVQGRAFRVTCRQCGNQIRVAAGQPAAAPAAAPPRPPPPAAARPPPAAPPRPPPPPPPAAPLPHLTPPTTHVAGAGTAPRSAALQGMTDAEMAWLGSATPPPRPLTPPPPEPTAPADPVHGSTTDVEAAEAAFAALEAAAREEPGAEAGPARSALDAGPDELPPLPEPEDAGPAEPARRGPGPLRIAAAAVLVLLAGAVAAWQLGWLGPRPAPPAPVPPALARPVLPPVQPPAPEPAPPPIEAPPAPADPAAALPAAAPAVPGDAPAPAVGPARRQAPPAAGDRATKNLRIARKDRRLLDLLEKKGDAAPAAPIERSTLDTGLAELDQPAVERAMAESRPAFAACITRALKADPTLKLDDQKATLMLTVRPNGTVSRAWVAEADLEATPLGRCLVGAARRVVFPAFQGEALDVSAPLVLGAIR